MPILEARHDLPHAVENDPAWSESWYFNAYAPEARAGFVTRIGIRPNQGSAHMLVIVWLPDGSIAQCEDERAAHEIVDGPLQVGAVRYERVRPLGEWAVGIGPTTIDGRQVEIDARFRALGPAVGVDRAGAAPASDGVRDASRRSLAAGHLEQPGAWSGSITVDGRRLSFEGFGNRDKSWGPRDTSGDRGLRMWRWFSINLGAETHAGGILAGTAAGDLHRGWIHDRGTTTSVRRWHVKTDVAEDGLTQRALTLGIEDARGTTHRLRGEVLRVATIGIGEARGMRVLEGLTRFERDGRSGYGIAEYAHLVDASGRPLVPIE